MYAVYLAAVNHSLRWLRKQRAERWAALMTPGSGVTLQDIADSEGISRERVRQILKAEGRTVARGGKQSNVLLLLAEIRRPGVTSFQQVRAHERDRRQLRALGLLPAVVRLFRMRRRQRADTAGRIIRAIQQFVAEQGRTPTTAEMCASPEMSSFQHAFRNPNGALRAAGFAGRQRGGAGHLAPRRGGYQPLVIGEEVYHQRKDGVGLPQFKHRTYMGYYNLRRRGKMPVTAAWTMRYEPEHDRLRVWRTA